MWIFYIKQSWFHSENYINNIDMYCNSHYYCVKVTYIFWSVPIYDFDYNNFQHIEL